MFFKEKTVTHGQSIVNLFSEYFSRVYTESDVDDSFLTHSLDNVAATGSQQINSLEISAQSLRLAFNELEISTNSGPDHIPQYFFSKCWLNLEEVVLKLFNKSLTDEVFARDWKLSYVLPTFKKGDPQNIQNYRPISVLNFLSKLLDSIVSRHIIDFFVLKVIPEQHGFMSGRSTVTNLLLFNQYVTSSLTNKQQLDTIYIDYSKAFDSVNHSILLEKLAKFGITGSLLSWVKSYLSNRKEAVRMNGFTSSFRIVTSGVPQGSHLGPILFNIFINDISSCIENSKILLYADDVKLSLPVSSISDAIRLQSDLDSLQNWSMLNKLNISFEKCAVMTFSRKLSPVQFDYSVSGVRLNRVEKISDLGVIYTSNFDFSEHIHALSLRASRLLGFIYRTTKNHFNTNSLILLFNSLIVPILTYCSVIWSPHTITHTKLLEGIHHKLIRYICFRSGQPMDFTDHNYDEAITKFKIPKIESLHRYHDILTVYKIRNGITNSLDLSNLFITRQTQYNVRSQREVLESTAPSNYLFFSSIPRLQRNWNLVPSDMRSLKSISTFKSAVKLYLYGFN